MSTDKRELIPNGIYHVYNRGNNKMTLFHDREDFNFFLSLLKRFMIEYEFALLAVCLMSNHFHLVIIDKGVQLPLIMDAIESVYACYYIDKYKYKGRVFESRFKSNLIRSKLILLILVRYINRNPIVARITNNIIEYPWSIPTLEKDKFKLINFKLLDILFKEQCKLSYLEYLKQAVDDMWIDPIEVQRMEDSEALVIFNTLAERIDINIEALIAPVYNDRNSSFINVCHTHGITYKQIKKFTGLSMYKIDKHQKFNRKL